MSELENWLKQFGLEGLAGVLGQHDIDLEILAEVTDADLGISGRSAERRTGFREVVSRVCLGEVGAELVNPDETGRLDNYCVIGTSVGLLIQAGPGNAGGRGTWRTKRSGCAT